MGGGDNVLELDTPVVRMACNLKCLRDQAAILCAVHEAVGLEDLKKISEAFRHDIADTCAFIKKYILVSFNYLTLFYEKRRVFSDSFENTIIFKCIGSGTWFGKFSVILSIFYFFIFELKIKFQ